MISLFQASASLSTARESRAAVLAGETLRITAPEIGLVREAQGAAAALAQSIAPLAGDDAACVAAVTAFNRELPQASIVAFVPDDGVMTCGSGGRSFDYRDTSLFREIMSDLRPKVVVQARGPVSGVSVVLVVHPVLAADGQGSLGYVAIALPHAALGAANSAPGPYSDDFPDPDFVTFNGEGTVLTTSRGYGHEAELLPAGIDLADLAARDVTGLSGTTAAGEERLYSLVPLIPGQLYALGSVPRARRRASGRSPSSRPFLLVVLMWAGSFVVAWLAAERIVTRYIRRLSRAIRAFASGSRMVSGLDMAGASAELREVGQAFLRMTDTILHDEAELEDTVHQREVLLREVHHRVKNNLQLIASIMNMQMRRARSPETKALMRGLQDRVMSLATVHKELYQTSGLTDVRADELLGDITRQIMSMASAPGRTFRIETGFAPIPLTPDQAVPLSLLLTEGLTNAVKYAEPAPGEAAPWLGLSFAALDGGRAELTIANTAGTIPVEAPAAEGTGLGRQLVTAFASQLGGEVRTEVGDGRFILRVAFVLAAVRGYGAPLQG
ncbi:hypothetical protein Rumeso_03587 [Rubellimicrobium mesophilum DSM 19309]|uniref:histidine kinase n=1 Tax=Rubellimicrobium mesophilum DSM 19309 TaxID=442562 RepID=A0A017HK25_9RHOB|nr:hypothetical protein Rumeso_03587 [Rubellimicrobium mesophilum DSM 19309]